MSNMPAIDKRKVSLQIPIKTILKVDRMAEASGLSRNEVASAILDRGTKHIELTDEDLLKFEEEVRRNRNARMHA
jgi:hypothetical protein